MSTDILEDDREHVGDARTESLVTVRPGCKGEETALKDVITVSLHVPKKGVATRTGL
ncbi:MAG TPA: hypothetical protein VFM96_13300 [Gaiellaceae bacterium]|nr:hypothetical protein [Gaiellaceae bacterium]